MRSQKWAKYKKQFRIVCDLNWVKEQHHSKVLTLFNQFANITAKFLPYLINLQAQTCVSPWITCENRLELRHVNIARAKGH